MVKKIEETFGVDTSTISMSTLPQSTLVSTEEKSKANQLNLEESTTFDVILKEVPPEDQRSKRLTVFRIIRELTSLGLKESKELTNSLPKPIKESISKQEAEDAKKQLESAGAKVIIQ